MKEVAVGALMRDGLVLACRRRTNTRYPLKWEFPGGKIEPGEQPPEALKREMREELDIQIRDALEFHRQQWTYPDGSADPARDGTFRVHYYLVRDFAGEPVNRVFEEIRWVAPRELLDMDILEGNREAIVILVGHGRKSHP
jgi:8-oxo-dGTP diphosphatase